MTELQEIAIELAVKGYLTGEDEQRASDQEKAYWYYECEKKYIAKYLDDVLVISFEDEDLEEMQKAYINITKKIINQTSVIYRRPAVRKIKIDDKENEELTSYYNEHLPSNINTKNKKTHRLSKLLNKTLTRVYFDKEQKRIQYLIEPSHVYRVVVDDEYRDKIKLLAYDKMLPDGVAYTIIWTKDENYRITKDGKILSLPNNESKKNPYGIIPYAALEMEEMYDYWGSPQNDLINVNEQINLLKTLLINDHVILGSGGTILGVNLTPSKRGKEKSGSRRIRTGRRHPILVDDLRNDQVPPSLTHITSNPQITEMMNLIDWEIKSIASMKGLDPNAFLTEVKATSGFSKVMDGIVQMEIRQDDIEPCREYETELFEITKIINNYHVRDGMKMIPKEAKIDIDFAEIEQIKTFSEEKEEREFNKEHNLETPIDWMIQKNPDLDEPEAIEQLRKNRLINTTEGSNEKPNMVESLISKLNKNNGKKPEQLTEVETS
uniref:Putative portal protein n=1 Tax=viral metagenome TaxID=1070528 RepID=A0A6M3JXS6_9ZZZZ